MDFDPSILIVIRCIRKMHSNTNLERLPRNLDLISWILFRKKNSSIIICYSSGIAYSGWPSTIRFKEKVRQWEYNFMKCFYSCSKWHKSNEFFILHLTEIIQKFKRKWIWIAGFQNIYSTAHIYSHCDPFPNTIYHSNPKFQWKTENFEIEMKWRMSTGIVANNFNETLYLFTKYFIICDIKCVGLICECSVLNAQQCITFILFGHQSSDKMYPIVLIHGFIAWRD